MDLEKYPHYFLIVIVLYVLVFAAGLSYFIFPSVSFGGVYGDFYLIMLLFFLPLVLLALYTKIDESFFGKFRMAITILTISDLLFVVYLMILLL